MKNYTTIQQSLALWFLDDTEVDKIQYPRHGFVVVPNNTNSYDFCVIGKDESIGKHEGVLPGLGFLEKIDHIDIKKTLKKYGGIINKKPENRIVEIYSKSEMLADDDFKDLVYLMDDITNL